MKILMIILVLWAQSSYGQTWSEWFRQKKTQKKYLLEQIAAFKLYGNYLAKGYAITKGGLKTIGSLKLDCFEQDETFLESLKIVSPRIKQYKKVAELLALHARLSFVMNKSMQYVNGTDLLTTAENGYIQGVWDRVTAASEADIDRLMQVITNDRIEMSDDERISAIDKLYDSARDQQSFIQSFDRSVRILARQRMSEQMQIKKSKILNGLE